MPQNSSSYLTWNALYGCWIDARVTNLRLNHTSDQVLWDVDGFGILAVKAGVGGLTNLAFTPARAGGGTLTLDITGRTSLMARVAFDYYHARYFMQVWDVRGQNTIIASAATTDASQLPLAGKAYSVGAKRNGTLAVQAAVDFFRLVAPKGMGHSPTSDAPFPDYIGYFDFNTKLLRYEFESNLTNQGEGVSSLTASGSISYSANANTTPVALGEDRTGQSKGTFLLNGTDSYDFEHLLSNTATWTCQGVPTGHAGCGSLTIRDGSKLATFVDGANVAGVYTFSLQVSDGTLTSTDSSVTIGVSNVSASALNATCYVGESCVIDASASTGYETIEVSLGDGFNQRIARSAHTYYAAGTYPITVTAQAADGTTASSNTATATVTNRPSASGANTIDMTSSANATYFVSTADCTGDPTGNMTKLQAALDAAKAINTAPQKIIVRANNGSGSQCVYQGSLNTRQPAGTAQILIQSSAIASLPGLHQRINPAAHAQFMPKLLTTTANSPVLQPRFGEVPAYYKFEGIDFQASSTQDTAIVAVGDPEQITSETKMPHNFVFWHCAFRPTSESSVNIKNAITVNGHSVTVLDSYLGPNSYHGNESHGIGLTYGTKLSFVNNFNGAASIPILVGGATSLIEGATSADIEYRQNYNFRNPAWQTDTSRARAIKNLFELKNAIRVVVEGNRMENNWVDAQAGHAILFQCVFDSGDWCKIEDVDFRNNFILNSTSIGTVNGREYMRGTNVRRMAFRNNLWQNINPPAYGNSSNPTPHLSISRGPLDIRLEHNTFRQPNGNKTVSLVGDPDGDNTGEERTAGFIWRNNIADGWGCGFFGDSTSCGLSGINHYLHGYVISHSVAVGDSSTLYPSTTPSGNMMFPSTEAAVGFTNPAANDWSLLTSSAYKGGGSGGSDPGVNWTVLQSAIAHTTDGDWAQASSSLPSPWQTQDIGQVGVAGSANHSGGTFTVNGSGTDIWGASDSFRYVYQTLAGDGQIIARVTGLQNTNGSAKAGLMIRETLADNSAHVILDLNPTIGGATTEFMKRASAGANMAFVAGGNSVSMPHWLRLVRSGNTFTAHLSSDGITWTQLGSTTVSMTNSVYVGLIVCSVNNTTLNTSTFDNVNASASTALPSPWQAQDIGSVGVAGTSTYSGGTFTVNGSGADIWGSADSFRYVYQALSGDGQIVARVTGVQNTNGSAKAGVMIRESLTDNSAHVVLDLNPTIGGATTEFMKRASTGANASFIAGGGNVLLPQWLKLVRTGNTFDSYLSSDGTNWTLLGSTTVSMNSNVYIGLVVCSVNNTTLNTSTFDNVSKTP
jgi:regulation of enolase protein 1 (concanavalin A-like superfamily)